MISKEKSSVGNPALSSGMDSYGEGHFLVKIIAASFLGACIPALVFYLVI